jgi:Fe-S-cluster containining protein
VADHFKIKEKEAVERYFYFIEGFYVAWVRKGSHCPFLVDAEVKRGKYEKRCTIYDMRPLQCREFPLYKEDGKKIGCGEVL